MKTAFYVEDGLAQVVLTPVTPFEKRILSEPLFAQEVKLEFHRGEFYENRAGWVRHGLSDFNSDSAVSVMITIRPKGEGA